MAQLQLTQSEIEAVESLVGHARNVRHLRRALAILWLCRGEPAQRVAERLCVSRATVYNWAARFQGRRDMEPTERVADAARSGRPATRRVRKHV
jgi:transposase